MTDQDAELTARLDAFDALLTGVGRRGAEQDDRGDRDDRGDQDDQDAYERVEAARLALGAALGADRAATARLAGRVLGLLVRKWPWNAQLTGPLIGAIGHRATLEALTALVRQGSWQQRGNAAAAAYHLPFHRDPAPLAALAAEHRSSPLPREQLQERYREALRLAHRPAEPYADLWPRFWLAAAECFTACPDREVRDHLALAFPLEHPDHLPEAAPVLAEARRTARRTAAREPGATGHRRLLAGSTGYGAAL
ncbi:hypothetical protein [Kitasatospora phosalacinea]|uniref:Uncharacterized protein n=1 Tax=Kitasatospora phosalacinea TaxID=2065 RepID=A0ABW6GG26_9ACTN